MKTKKWLCMLLACLLLFSTGCTRQDNEAESSQNIDEDNFKIALFLYQGMDELTKQLSDSLESQLATNPQYVLKIFDASNNQTIQNRQILESVLWGADILLVNMVDLDSAATVKGLADGIPLVFINREPYIYNGEAVFEGEDPACFVGPDTDTMYSLLGEMVYDILSRHKLLYDYNNDEFISYLYIIGEDRSSPHPSGRENIEDTVNAIDPRLASFGKQLEQIGYQSCGWDRREAKEYVDTLLKSYPPTSPSGLECIIVHNDAMALGALDALMDAGFNLENEDSRQHIPVFGIDGTDEAIEAISEGRMDGTLAVDNEGIAACLGFLIDNIANGKDLMDGADTRYQEEIGGYNNRGIFIPYKPVTRETLETEFSNAK